MESRKDAAMDKLLGSNAGENALKRSATLHVGIDEERFNKKYDPNAILKEELAKLIPNMELKDIKVMEENEDFV